jgi:hypothetical protein
MLVAMLNRPQPISLHEKVILDRKRSAKRSLKMDRLHRIPPKSTNYSTKAGILAAGCFLAVWMVSFSALAQEGFLSGKNNFLASKGGVFIPTSDFDELKRTFHTEVMFNTYFSKHAALEAGLGLYKKKANFGAAATHAGSAVGRDEIPVIPVKVNIKKIFSIPRGELYAGVGLGVYFAGTETDVTFSGMETHTLKASDVVLGCQMKAGAVFNIDKTFFFGIEGEYMITDTAEFSDKVNGGPITVSTDLNGYAIDGVLGMRF